MTDQDTAMTETPETTFYSLTIWTPTISMQVRDADVALHVMEGAPRSAENGHPVLIPKDEARRIRDLLNMATARAEL